MNGAEGLFRPGDSPLHRLAPQTKVVALVVFSFAVAATDREAVWAFGAYAAILVALFWLARIPAGWIMVRSLVETPFLLLALAFPFLVGGATVEAGPLDLSIDGLWAGWNLFAKATLGVWAALLLAATTPVAALLAGLARLRCPDILLQITAFAVRYAHLTIAEVTQMRLARLARCDDPRFLWQAGALARSLGTVFIRSFERGERIWQAMAARGYTGRLPLDVGPAAASARQWTAAMGAPALAAGIAMWTAVAM
ncbi:cobalt ECF transporter T component CbiQ [Glycomyces buryatensis]|uniref:Cobalt ECF transporter T component CbiQ n=1 Tax=Glycomyces buryatensis TaxID=2570927 RepID=A0A4V4HSN3_9ACTN|nr:cobalt ECF transporter T component CbiQ [Glycomyces buryatensis]THV42346.1 cobalt ECF transporter T component CbiQ [Glycomyces buryatensis]